MKRAMVSLLVFAIGTAAFRAAPVFGLDDIFKIGDEKHQYLWDRTFRADVSSPDSYKYFKAGIAGELGDIYNYIFVGAALPFSFSEDGESTQ